MKVYIESKNKETKNDFSIYSEKRQDIWDFYSEKSKSLVSYTECKLGGENRTSWHFQKMLKISILNGNWWKPQNNICLEYFKLKKNFFYSPTLFSIRESWRLIVSKQVLQRIITE